jgi:outer membrane protein TolC
MPLPIATSGTLSYDVEGAILESLTNNQALKVQKMNPPLRRLNEQTERAAFDPTLTASASYSRSRTERESATGAMVETTSKRTAGAVGISEFLPTGTNVNLDLSAQRTWATDAGDANTAVAGLSVTQSLLRGASLNANLASLRQARLDTVASEYELRGVVLQQVASVEETYWDYSLAQKQIKIYTDSVLLAEQQLSETKYRVEYGKLAPTELAAAEAEVATRREGLINAQSTLATTRLRLLRLINPADPNLWNRDIALRNEPIATRIHLEDVATHVKLAMKMRPDLNQARLSAQKGELDVVRTRNGLLPRLDMFITLGGTGYADSFSGSVKAEDGKTYDGQIGFNFEYPLLNRGPRASYLRSKIGLAQTEEALANTAQLVEVDVRSAYIEVIRTREQVPATEATRKLQAEALRAETEKFRVGKSTSLLVAQAQRNYLSAQIDEIRAVAGYLKAVVELYRLDGSLLEQRGIAAPGRNPVSNVAWKTR